MTPAIEIATSTAIRLLENGFVGGFGLGIGFGLPITIGLLLVVVVFYTIKISLIEAQYEN